MQGKDHEITAVVEYYTVAAGLVVPFPLICPAELFLQRIFEV